MSSLLSLSWVRPSWKPWSRTRSVWSRSVSSRCLWSKPRRWSVEDQSETTHTHTHKLFLLFIELSLFHRHLSIFPQFPPLVGEGPSSSRKSDSVSVSVSRSLSHQHFLISPQLPLDPAWLFQTPPLTHNNPSFSLSSVQVYQSDPDETNLDKYLTVIPLSFLPLLPPCFLES